ncbi:hypothetical protein ASA1KI_27670 [Opitutales bacterium ASA1]|uniref:hypothetical protein n=1 Tax=Congregicoccus parvus TaxID=3081749 RepID=UPI002B32590A|nr:hypothetical protein ASA1KI_27670 [Opitutales bacterium ASA1]
MLKTALSIVAAVACALPSGLSAAREPLPVNTEKELRIVVHDNVMPRRRDPWTSRRMERERYLEFETAIKAAIEEAGYQGPVKVTQAAANIPETEQRLDVFIYRWETGIESFGVALTAEFTMEAVLHVGEREFEMGTFSARASTTALGDVEPEDYRPAARRAIDQMIEYYRDAIEKRG